MEESNQLLSHQDIPPRLLQVIVLYLPEVLPCLGIVYLQGGAFRLWMLLVVLPLV